MRLLACASLVVAGAWFAAAAPASAASKGASKAKFKRQGTVFSGAGVGNPDVVSIGKGKGLSQNYSVAGPKWRMYYMEGGNVLSARSTSASARRFSKEGGVRLANADHPAIAQLPDGRTRMYFVRPGQGGARDLLSAISSNGLDFTEEPGVRLPVGQAGSDDEVGMIHPSAVATPGGGWRIYYDAEQKATGSNDLGWGHAILSASSPDGLTFTRDAGSRITPYSKGLKNSFMVWSAAVVRSGKAGSSKAGSSYTMFFSSDANANQRKLSGVYQAQSKDGLNFKIQPKRPVLGVDPSVEEIQQGPGGPTGVPQDPFVIDLRNGSRRMFYWQREKGTLTAVRR